MLVSTLAVAIAVVADGRLLGGRVGLRCDWIEAEEREVVEEDFIRTDKAPLAEPSFLEFCAFALVLADSLETQADQRKKAVRLLPVGVHVAHPSVLHLVAVEPHDVLDLRGRDGLRLGLGLGLADVDHGGNENERYDDEHDEQERFLMLRFHLVLLQERPT